MNSGKKMTKENCLLINLDHCSPSRNGWQKDAINYALFFDEKYELKTFSVVECEKGLKVNGPEFEFCASRIGTKRISILNRFSVRLLLKVASHIIKFKPKIIFITPYYKAIPYLLILGIFAKGRIIVYMADPPSLQMSFAKKRQDLSLKKLKYTISTAIYRIFEHATTFIGWEYIVVTKDAEEYIYSKSIWKTKCHIIPPAFALQEDEVNIYNQRFDVIILRPNSYGADLVYEALQIKDARLSLNVAIVGGDRTKDYWDRLNFIDSTSIKVTYFDYLVNMDSAIKSALFCVISDLDGIGFSNRAGQVFINGGMLLSTKNGVRGIDAIPGEHFLNFESADQLRKYLKVGGNRGALNYDEIRNNARTLGNRYNLSAFNIRIECILR